jgi:CheY-like chemotaxis protein/cytidylate kinase
MMAIVTLFSGSYCHADEIADGVSQTLNYPIINDQLYETASERFGVSADDLRSSLTESGSILGRFKNTREKSVANLRLVLSELIQSDNLIVTGCPGLLLPRTIGHVLRVCLIANQDYRVREAMSSEDVSEKEAGKRIHESDKENFACTDFLFGKTAYDDSLFDIVLPMQDSSVEQAVKTICDHARSEPLKTTERSQRAAADFVLAAQVGLKLAEEGLAAEVHAESGQVILSINKSVVRLNHYREQLKKAAEEVPGVTDATTRLGPRYRPSTVNPWSQIEGPPKIMLVDDEKEFVHTLSERLRTRDIESSIAYDGEQALEMVREETPDVIVLDLMMPGIDGIETLRRLKRDHPQVEVIILTGHGSDREKQIAEELGAFAYLRKPVDIDSLARVMREAYGRTGRSKGEPPDQSL